ncbi:phage tail tape measure protein [Burkholderia alba]|uniref:phage tail tape measure protein n=1 Tax=Burkholderia alba TaxID=2683677 RepID=UPI002B0524C0|nr:phage tail tape measure protein [Burkholderia alba]
MSSNKRLNAIITIGGAVSSGLRTAFSSASKGLSSIGDSIRELDKRQRLLGKSIDVFRKAGMDVTGLQAKYSTLIQQTDRLRFAQSRLLEVERARERNAQRREALLGKIPFGHHLGTIASVGGVIGALHAYQKINDAETDLKVAMLDSRGQVPVQFEEIRKQAIALHNVLPGTLADFHNVAIALKENGVSAEMIAGGALTAAAQLGVVLKMPIESAAEMTAKLRESFQLSEHELGRMADLTQRARFAFGLKPDDLLLGAKYYGGSLGGLKVQGADAVRKIYALQGQAAQNGIDGSTFGTNFGMMLTRIATLSMTLKKHSPQMREVGAILKRNRIELQFFDKKGSFAGIDNMVAQLGKLQNIASDEQRSQVLKALFGQEAARPAELISRKGVAGYQASLKAEDEQASIQQRISVSMGSLTNKLTALTGSIETFIGVAAEPLGKALIPILDRSNQFVSHTLIPWVEAHPKLTRNIEFTIGALVGLRFATLAFGLAANLVRGGVLSLIAPIIRFGAAAVMASVGLSTGGFAAQAFGIGLRFIGSSMLWVGRALLLNPIGLAITALAVSAYLIYENWGKLKPWFKGLWAGIKADFLPFVGWIQDKFSWIGVAWAKVKEFASGGGDPGSGGDGGALDTSPSAGRPANGPRDAPPMASARGSGGTVIHDNSQTTIQVHQQPGENADALAERIHRKLKERAGVSQRGMLYDPAMAG